MIKIFINPGHGCSNGGEDPGAVGYGLHEDEVAFCIGTRVEKYLQNAGVTTKVYQYGGKQNDKDNVVLGNICDTSNYWGADIFVSIHCNAFNGAANGTETYYYPGSTEGNKLANAIHNKIINTIPDLTNRGVKSFNHFVTHYTDAPAALVECAFIDNKHDNDLLKYRANDFAQAIAKGILEYAGIKPDVVDSHNICPYCGKAI
jgi:N-acetylmuramoyl-L-alanine amidase